MAASVPGDGQVLPGVTMTGGPSSGTRVGAGVQPPRPSQAAAPDTAVATVLNDLSADAAWVQALQLRDAIDTQPLHVAAKLADQRWAAVAGGSSGVGVWNPYATAPDQQVLRSWYYRMGFPTPAPMTSSLHTTGVCPGCRRPMQSTFCNYCGLSVTSDQPLDNAANMMARQGVPMVVPTMSLSAPQMPSQMMLGNSSFMQACGNWMATGLPAWAATATAEPLVQKGSLFASLSPEEQETGQSQTLPAPVVPPRLFSPAEEVPNLGRRCAVCKKPGHDRRTCPDVTTIDCEVCNVSHSRTTGCPARLEPFEPTLPCETCGLKFANAGQLKVHVRALHASSAIAKPSTLLRVNPGKLPRDRDEAVVQPDGTVQSSHRPVCPLPYEVDKLNWDADHAFNRENVYCYCGKPCTAPTLMVQCHQCKNLFHLDCTATVGKAPLVGDSNYKFTCSNCGNGEESYLLTSRVRLRHLTTMMRVSHARCAQQGQPDPAGPRTGASIGRYVGRHWAQICTVQHRGRWRHELQRAVAKMPQAFAKTEDGRWVLLAEAVPTHAPHRHELELVKQVMANAVDPEQLARVRRLFQSGYRSRRKAAKGRAAGAAAAVSDVEGESTDEGAATESATESVSSADDSDSDASSGSDSASQVSESDEQDDASESGWADDFEFEDSVKIDGMTISATATPPAGLSKKASSKAAVAAEGRRGGAPAWLKASVGLASTKAAGATSSTTPSQRGQKRRAAAAASSPEAEATQTAEPAKTRRVGGSHVCPNCLCTFASAAALSRHIESHVTQLLLTSSKSKSTAAVAQPNAASSSTDSESSDDADQFAGLVNKHLKLKLANEWHQGIVRRYNPRTARHLIEFQPAVSFNGVVREHLWLALAKDSRRSSSSDVTEWQLVDAAPPAAAAATTTTTESAAADRL